MGQEVKNHLRAQLKYGLMGSSAKTEKKIFRGSPEHFLDKNAISDRTPPSTHQLQPTCVGEGSRVPNLQTEFNYLNSFESYGIFSDFVVPAWSLSSLCHPHRPHIIPVIPTSSPHHPHHPHAVPIAPRRSPWSVVSTCCPRCPHIVPIIPTSSPSFPHCLEGPHIIPNPPDTWSTHLPPPWGDGGPESVKMQ